MPHEKPIFWVELCLEAADLFDVITDLWFRDDEPHCLLSLALIEQPEPPLRGDGRGLAAIVLRQLQAMYQVSLPGEEFQVQAAQMLAFDLGLKLEALASYVTPDFELPYLCDQEGLGDALSAAARQRLTTFSADTLAAASRLGPHGGEIHN